MNCVVCNSCMSFYFTKDFNEYGLTKVDYHKCDNCGLVVAKDLIELPLKEWEKLNVSFHSKFLYLGENPLDPNWQNRLHRQADLLEELVHVKNLLPNKRLWLDYACGDGSLRKLLMNEKDILVCGYDKYVGAYRLSECKLSEVYEVVINTSYLEHTRNREEIDIVNNLIEPTGALAMNTLICENIPNDPNWFYFWPVHCFFFTNKAAQILFDQWGFKCSIYNPEARMWIWFKKEIDQTKAPSSCLYKESFVDYWK